MSLRAAATATAGQFEEPQPELERLEAALDPKFLEEAGWDPGKRLLNPPHDHPLLGVRICQVGVCNARIRVRFAALCVACTQRQQQSGVPLEEFVTAGRPTGGRGQRMCLITNCGRPSGLSAGLCAGHGWDYSRRGNGSSVAEWIARDKPAGKVSWGPCIVSACLREASNSRQMCQPHRNRWRDQCNNEGLPDTVEERHRWATTAEPISRDCLVVLAGLPRRIEVQMLLGLQQRTQEGERTSDAALRIVVQQARTMAAEDLTDLLDFPGVRPREASAQLIRVMIPAMRRALSNPEVERHLDVWELRVFGARGRMRFTGIHQRWLREAAKHWVGEELPLHRGRSAGLQAQMVVLALNQLSDSLRATRPDEGLDLTQLGRQDIVNLANRLAYLESSGDCTSSVRLRHLRAVRRFLSDVRALSMTRPGGLLAGLPDDFMLRLDEVPRLPQRLEPGRDLPAATMRTITDNLDLMEAAAGREKRVITELLIDTGRRPDEICRLPWDCLDRDSSGKSVLLYTNFKNNRLGLRLPIAEATADLLLRQRDRTRARFPDTDLAELALFPSVRKNPYGRTRTDVGNYGYSHREFVLLIADRLLDDDGITFPKADCTPYSYRHSFAQRHADNGTAPDVLRDLMGHKSMTTTMRYYRVSEHRVRGAVDQIARHQFDGQGRRVFVAVTGLLNDEHARMRVGQVAVPFGVCTEPSNVKAGGHACPYKFTCLGCGHFRSDASYLPELKSYLQQLLADRERLLGATDIQDWAKAKAMPADQEIQQLRALIRRVEEDMESLTEVDRATILAAVDVVRSARQTVNIGMPSVPAVTAGHRR